MENHERTRIEALVDRDEELGRLWREHLEYEQRLADMEQRSHLTPQESMERRQVQKLKLAGKDQIAKILDRYASP